MVLNFWVEIIRMYLEKVLLTKKETLVENHLNGAFLNIDVLLTGYDNWIFSKLKIKLY